MREGYENGIEAGEKNGIKIGKELGKKEEKNDLAKKMIQEKIPVETIMKITGLSVREFNELK